MLEPRPIKLWVVLKAPVDLPDAFAFVGVFGRRALVVAACKAPGTYKIGYLEVNRTYEVGQLLDVEIITVLDHRQF